MVVAGLAAALSLAASLAARRFAAALGRSSTSLLLGGRDQAYYADRLHTALLAWAVVVPLLVVAWYVLAQCCRGVTDGSRFAAQRWRILAPALALVASASLVPRYRTGDEPAYLLMANSLATRGTYASASPSSELHSSAVSRPGEYRSVHNVGLSTVLAVPYRLLGDGGAEATMVFIAVGCLFALRRLLAEVTEPPTATLVAGVLAVSFPLLTFAPLVLPELTGALGLAVLYRDIVRRRKATLAGALFVAGLPWFHVRFLPGVAWLVLLGLVAVRPRRSALVRLAAPLAATIVLMAIANLRWFGSPWPSAMWAGRPHLVEFGRLVPGAIGVFVDQQYGLLVWAPLFLLVPLGLVELWRRSRFEVLALAVLTVLTVGPALLAVWYGGWSPGGRYLVPLLGPLAMLAAVGVETALGGRRADRLIVGWIITAQVGIGAICALLPDKVYGTMPEPARNYFLDLASRLTHVDIRWVLPSLAAEPGRWPPIVFGAVLVAAWLALSAGWWRRLASGTSSPLRRDG
jgi:hypothetical protein